MLRKVYVLSFCQSLSRAACTVLLLAEDLQSGRSRITDLWSEQPKLFCDCGFLTPQPHESLVLVGNASKGWNCQGGWGGVEPPQFIFTIVYLWLWLRLYICVLYFLFNCMLVLFSHFGYNEINIHTCLQALNFEWKSALNFNSWAKFQIFQQLTPKFF